jgi:hypothetical protein
MQHHGICNFPVLEAVKDIIVEINTKKTVEFICLYQIAEQNCNAKIANLLFKMGQG